VAMIMKDYESWVILSWTFVMKSVLSVLFIKSWTQSCIVFIMSLIIHGTFTMFLIESPLSDDQGIQVYWLKSMGVDNHVVHCSLVMLFPFHLIYTLKAKK
jgi:hypothetical protein